MTKRIAPQGPGSLIIIGCAGGSDILSTIATEGPTPDRIVLFDLLSQEETALPDRLHGKDITHVQAIPSPESGKAEAIFYSLPGLVSLTEPTEALRTLFPGLRERARGSVDLIAPDALAAHLSDLPQPLTCVMDLPGAEAGILDALDAAGVLTRLSVLRLRCGIEPFFTDALASSEIANSLIARGFTLGTTNTEDPDWPELYFAADPRVREIERLQEQLTAVTQDHATCRQALETARRHRDDGRAALERQQAEQDALRSQLAARDRDLAETRAALEEHNTLMEDLRQGLSEREAALKAVTEERDTLRPRMGSLNAELETARKALQDRDAALTEARRTAEDRAAKLAEVEARLSDREAALKAVTEERDAQRGHLERLGAELETARKALLDREAALAEARKTAEDRAARQDETLGASSAALEAAERKCEQARSDQAFQARVNTMLQIDLDNLRAQYDASEDQRRKQEDLLRKLTPKLAQAAERLQQLQLTPAEEVPALAQEDTPGRTAKKSSPRKSATQKRRTAARPKQDK